MKVQLLNYFGNDEMVANVARVSFAKEAAHYTVDQNAKLIKFLAIHGHTSPFRHPQLQFRLTMPLYVERQIFKHQVGVSVNSISGRYVDFSDTYHEIEQFRSQSKHAKQGSGVHVSESVNDKARAVQRNLIDHAKDAYKDLLKLGICKEQARTLLPLSLNTECIMTFSLLALSHLFHLRLKSDVQEETRELTKLMYVEVMKLDAFQVSLHALVYETKKK